MVEGMLRRIMNGKQAQDWADRIEREMGGYDWDTFSLAYSAGKICGVDIDVEADDWGGRRFASADGSMTVRYNGSSGHWYGES